MELKNQMCLRVEFSTSILMEIFLHNNLSVYILYSCFYKIIPCKFGLVKFITLNELKTFFSSNKNQLHKLKNKIMLIIRFAEIVIMKNNLVIQYLLILPDKKKRVIINYKSVTSCQKWFSAGFSV